MSYLLNAIRVAGAECGLNLAAAIPIERYDNAVPAALRAIAIDHHARSIILIANGGAAFWHAFTNHAAQHPGWCARENPLDDFTRAIVECNLAPAARKRGSRCTPVYPFVNGGPTLNFMELAKLAGLAGPSILGVVVHPVYGPWIAFRAAMLVDAVLDEPGIAVGFDPCPSCTVRSCIPACPASAVNFATGWDIPRCLTHRVEAEQDCVPRCHARVGCVLGPEHRYPDDELVYHQARALRAMRPYYDVHIRPDRAR